MSEIYLDNAASTPIDPRVLRTYIYASQKYFGNPSNNKHEYGREAKKAMETARVKIGETLGLDPRGIIFTSGATEANNLALRGATCLQSKKCAALISSIEHACIDESARMLLKRGVDIKFIPTLPNGVIDLEKLNQFAKSTRNLKLISVMLVNNETGVIQPIHEVAKIAKQVGAIFHTDAVQGIGKTPVNILKNADMISISGHKINGPKGIGCLWVKPHVRLKPLLVGGGQESGIRSGTCPVPLIVAFGRAVELAVNDTAWLDKIKGPMRKTETLLAKSFPGVKINGAGAPRVPNISNLSFPYTKMVIDSLKGVAVAPGAACGCNKARPSKVLLSMGLGSLLARNVLRISACRFTTPEDILRAGRIIKSSIK